MYLRQQALPKDMMGKHVALHPGDWCEGDSVGDISNSPNAGSRYASAELINLQKRLKLEPTMLWNPEWFLSNP